jgi:anaerobic magnesium-protoporphyrin IX monomethyl ester cyclase
MAEVLLTHSNNLYSDRKQVEKMQPYPPLQTILAGSVLRQHGIETALFDPALESPDTLIRAFETALDRHQPSLVVVCEDDFNFLSKMCLIRNRELAYRMAEIARSRGIQTAVHGSDASDHTPEYLSAGFSFVLIGEVEATLLELAQGKQPETIHGLVYYERGSMRHTQPRAVSTDLGALPLPAWDLVDINRYRQTWIEAHGYFSLNMASSRGCPYHCNWCAKPIYGQKYHARTPQAVAAEMLYLKESFHPDHIWFADDIFALSPKWTSEFARTLDELRAHIPFKMQSRCDLMTGSTVAALKDAGCAEVWMGCESGSQAILDAMDKGIRVEQIYEAREQLRQQDIRACFFLQFGYPGEGWAEIEETIRMVRETAPDDIGISVSYPLPGTKFHQNVYTQIGSRSNWSDSADLAMVFQGAYPSEFYRALAEALHLEVRGGRFDAAAWERVYQLERMARLEAAVA